MSFFTTKSVKQFQDEASSSSLSKNLGVVDLTFLGVGGIIGAGIFILTGIAAAKYAGPGVSLSYVIAGCLCILVGLTYSEFASMIPASGSVYNYTFASLGEGFAFLSGWSLLLAYTVTASSVAVGLSGYLGGVSNALGWGIPQYLLCTPAEGGLFNLPSALLVLILSVVLIRGTKQSARLNFILVLVVLATIAAFICIAVPHVDATNFNPFLPFGVNGVMSGAAVVFFSFMGFDAVATSAEECKNPARDLPIGIILSIVICMALYVAVALSLTGVVNYTQLNTAEPVAYALRLLGWGTVANLLAIGVIAALVTTLIVYLFGQSRVFFAVARDGLLPHGICKLHPKFHTPYLTTAIGSIIIAVIAGFVPLMHIVELSNTGTLAVFFLNFFGIIAMRRKYPEAERKFHCPCVYLVSIVGIAVCGYMLYSLSTLTHVLFAAWMIIGLLIYGGYSRGHRTWDKEDEMNF